MTNFDYFVAEIVLEPDTRFTVVMVGADKEKSGAMKIVLDVKESEPVLESELVKFKSACEELEEEEDWNVNETPQGRRDLKAGFIGQEYPAISQLGGGSNLSFGSEGRGRVSFQGGDTRSGISVVAEGSEELMRGGLQTSKFESGFVVLDSDD